MSCYIGYMYMCMKEQQGAGTAQAGSAGAGAEEGKRSWHPREGQSAMPSTIHLLSPHPRAGLALDTGVFHDGYHLQSPPSVVANRGDSHPLSVMNTSRCVGIYTLGKGPKHYYGQDMRVAILGERARQASYDGLENSFSYFQAARSCPSHWIDNFSRHGGRHQEACMTFRLRSQRK